MQCFTVAVYSWEAASFSLSTGTTGSVVKIRLPASNSTVTPVKPLPPRWARCIAPAPRSPAYRYWRRPLQGNQRLARFVLPWPHSRCWLCWPLRCRLRQRKRWSADAVAVQGVLLNPICQEELYNPGRDVSINPNEDSIRTPWSPVPDVRLGYAPTGQKQEVQLRERAVVSHERPFGWLSAHDFSFREVPQIDFTVPQHQFIGLALVP